MAEVGTAFVTIVPSARGFGRSLEGQVGAETTAAGTATGKKFGGSFAGGASSVIKGVGISALLDVAIRGITGAMANARDAQKTAATTNAIIKATGGVAKVTKKDVDALTASIMRKTAIDDDQIAKGANLILTFKNVRNEVGKNNRIFDQATQAAVDLSAAGFGSLESASVMLGKALNDPVRGLTALSRAGVTFSASQKKRVKDLVEEGKILQAQKLILKEVQEQVGGTAAAQATNVDKLKTAIGNLGEAAGGPINSNLDTLAGNIMKLGNAGNNFRQTNAGRPIFSGFVSGALGPLASLKLALRGGVVDIGSFGKAYTRAKTTVTTAWAGTVSSVMSKGGQLLGYTRRLPGQIVGFFGGLPGQMRRIGSSIASGLLSGIRGAWGSVRSWVSRAISAIPSAIRGLLGIHSPSTVFAEIGKNMMLGLASGVRQHSDVGLAAVTSAVTGMSRTSGSFGATVSAGGVDSTRPIRMSDGTLFGWIREIAGGETELRLNKAAFYDAVGV